MSAIHSKAPTQADRDRVRALLAAAPLDEWCHCQAPIVNGVPLCHHEQATH